MLTKEQLLTTFPGAKNSKLDINLLVSSLSNALDKISFGHIDSKNRKAAFLAQTAHESAQFTAVKENLNYSAEALVKVFPKYFNANTAPTYGRNPEKIANKVYGGRMGNGDEASGEGWKFKGRGVIQITGKNNYTACAKYLGIDLIASPEQLESLPGAVDSAVWYWTTNNLNRYADADDIKTITKLINGGYIGLEERTHFYNEAKKIWS